jgi:hypothetical protein
LLHAAAVDHDDDDAPHHQRHTQLQHVPAVAQQLPLACTGATQWTTGAFQQRSSL